jgi:hypothetical protein
MQAICQTHHNLLHFTTLIVIGNAQSFYYGMPQTNSSLFDPNVSLELSFQNTGNLCSSLETEKHFFTSKKKN